MKICMLPRRCPLSWHAYRRIGVVVKWGNLAEHGPSRGLAIVADKACWGPWLPRQGPCRGSSSSGPTWFYGLSIFMRIYMLSSMHSPDLGLNVVDGVRALNPKGGGPAGLFASCPGKELVGGFTGRLGKACCRAWPCLPLAARYSGQLS